MDEFEYFDDDENARVSAGVLKSEILAESAVSYALPRGSREVVTALAREVGGDAHDDTSGLRQRGNENANGEEESG